MKNKTQLWQLLALLLCLCMTAVVLAACVAAEAEILPTEDSSVAEIALEEGSADQSGAASLETETAEASVEDPSSEETASEELSDAAEQSERKVITLYGEFGADVSIGGNAVLSYYYGGEIKDTALSKAIANHQGEDVLYRVGLILNVFSGTPENAPCIDERLQYAESLGIDIKYYLLGYSPELIGYDGVGENGEVYWYLADLSVEDMQALGEYGGFAFTFLYSGIEDTEVLDY